MPKMEITTREPDDTSADSLPMRPLSHHLALTVYWLCNTMLWGALLHLGYQSRLGDWFSEASVGYYLGILGFAGGIVGTATQIIAGAFSDRSLHPWGRRRPYVLVGSMLGVGALLLLGAANSYWPFLGALLLVQVCANSALGPFTALLPDTINPREHGKASGFMGVARLGGDTGGLVVAGLLLSAPEAVKRLGPASVVRFHDDRMFLLCAILGAFVFVTVIYTCLAIKERPLRTRPASSVREVLLNSFALDVRANRDFFWLSISRAVTNLGFYMFLEILMFFVLYTLRSPNPERQTMLILLPAIGAAALSSIPSGLISDRIGRRRPVFAAQFLMAAGAVMFLLAPSVKFALIAAVPAGLAYGVFTAVEWAYACNLLPEKEAARYLGIWNASAVVPQIAAFPIAGAIGSAISARTPGLGWRIDFAVVALCCLAGAYFLKHVRESSRRPRKASLERDTLSLGQDL